MSIEMKGITKQYPNVKALDDVNMVFPNNSIIGLIGFNGSGKTTSFNILTNLLEKFDGSVLIDGKPITQKDRYKFSYLSAGAEPQNQERVIDQLKYIGGLHGLNSKKLLEIIDPIVDVLEFRDKLKKPIKSLSKGNQQKIKLVQAFINPSMKYLLLDEPFDGLDPLMVEKIKNFILKRKKGLTIIVTSHRMEVVDSMCDSFYVLKDGVVVDSKVADRRDTTVLMEVNKEIPDSVFDKVSDILEVVRGKKTTVLKITDLKSFKKVNASIITSPKYIWSSLKEKKLTESVFEGYAND